jgi:hypothetical protein
MAKKIGRPRKKRGRPRKIVRRGPNPNTNPAPVEGMELSDREQIIFRILRQRRTASADDILKELTESDLKLNAKRGTHALGVMMKYLTAKACQEGFIISMVGGGQGAGNKASYRMEKRF